MLTPLQYLLADLDFNRYIWPAVISFAALLGLSFVLGIVFIPESKVGLVVKRFGLKNLPPGQIIAQHGESGYQAATLAPGLYFFYWFWQYRVERVPVTVVPQGEIGLVVAADGVPIPPGRILASAVDCSHYQDAVAFLRNKGEKGRQLSILTAGAYRINTALFQVITTRNAASHGLDPNLLRILRVAVDKVGIVTTLDGAPITDGEIAGPLVEGHSNFQNPQAFLNGGGHKGLQEQILLSGLWNVNPWFATVEQVDMVEIDIGYVGVVISYVGKEHEDVSGTDFKHGDLVVPGHKGVWVSPLFPGKHPLNLRVMRVELVPTTNIVLNWASRTEAHQYDQRLNSITVRSKDGFSFTLEVSQIIHVSAAEAPRVISRVGSMQNLVDHALQPIVGNYFRNSAQNYTVLDFLTARSDRQKEAVQHIRAALSLYNVEGIDTLIGEISAPAELMKTQTDRKIAEEQRKTYEIQEASEKQRQELVRQRSLADIQQQVVGAEQGVRIAELDAASTVKKSEGEAQSIRLKANGEADAIRATGEAKASAYILGVESLGSNNYALLQIMQLLAENNLRIVPDVAVTNSSGGGGLVDAMLGMLVQSRLPTKPPE